MDSEIPQKKLVPGVYQGAPGTIQRAENIEPSAPRIIRTMKSDADEAIKRQNETAVSIAIAEEKKRAEVVASKQAQNKAVSSAPKPVGRALVVVVILLICTALGLAYVFVSPKLGAIKLPKISIPSFGKPAGTTSSVSITPATASLAYSLIPAQSEKRFDINKQTPAQIFSAIPLEQEYPESIKNLYFTETAGATSTEISANRFLTFAKLQAPEILTRSLEKQFMAGIFEESMQTNPNGRATPFLILKVSSYETGLAGMLEWEASLPRGFDTIFGTKVANPANTKFRDVVILGKDARILEGAGGNTIAYTFANKNTIVLAGSRTALEKLLPLAAKN